MNYGQTYEIRWIKPYAKAVHIELPEGMPEVLCACEESDKEAFEMLKRVYIETKLLTNGYGFFCASEGVKRKTMSAETKLGMRRRRLRKVVEEKYPLFANEFEQRTLEENAEKYSLDGIKQKTSELENFYSETARPVEEAMTPAEVMEFLRKVYVVPFENYDVYKAAEARRNFVKRLGEYTERVKARLALEANKERARKAALDPENFELV